MQNCLLCLAFSLFLLSFPPHLVAHEQSRETRRGGGKSPLEMPAPRNVIPKPTHWNRAAYSKQDRTHKPAQTKHSGFDLLTLHTLKYVWRGREWK